MKSYKLFLGLLITCIIVISAYFYLQHQKYYPSTNDAYIQAHVTYIAPRVSGMITRTYIENYSKVKKNQPLFDIDSKPFLLALNQAQANLENTVEDIQAANSEVAAAQALVIQRQAELISTQKNYARTMILAKEHVYAQAQADDATANLKVAQAALSAAQNQLQEAIAKRGANNNANARIKAAQDAVAEAVLNLQYTHIVAPSDGYIINFNLQKGAEVNAYEELFALIADHTWWATANFKETDLARIHPGQSAIIRVDMYPNYLFKGVVTDIGAGSGDSFSLLPAENASGNWIKVTQRFPVKITINQFDYRYPLRFGASCTVTINTH